MSFRSPHLFACRAIACVIVVCAAADANADITFPGSNPDTLTGNGVKVVSGIEFEDGMGTITTIDATLRASGTIANEDTEILRLGGVGGAHKIEARIEDKASANGQDWHSTFEFDFGDPIDGIVITRGMLRHVDWADWQIDWTGSSSTAILSGNGLNPTRANLWDVSGVGGALLPNGNFLSGTMWRYDNNDTPDETVGVGRLGNEDWAIALPDAVTSITVTGWLHPNSIHNFQDEGVILDFNAAKIVPEPSSFAALSVVGVSFLTRRRTKSDGGE